MKKLLFNFLFIFCVSNALICQIQIHSFSAARSQSATTLNSPVMLGARAKLLNPVNFGPGGTYPKTVSIDDKLILQGNTTDISTKDIFFLGNFNIPNTVPPFSDDEIDSIYSWSLRGGKVILSAGQIYPEYGIFSDLFNSKWDFVMGLYGNSTGTLVTHTNPSAAGEGIFNGPFGNVTSVNQGGITQSFILSGPQNSQCFATIAGGGAWAAYLDCKTLDLIVADVDYFTSLGGISSDETIVNMQDKFWANTIAFMDTLQQPPVLIHTHDTLSVDKGYLSYQWYRNNQKIEGANAYSYMVTEPGNYHVETMVNGGCRVQSKDYYKDNCDVFVPTAFSPDGDGVNDVACAYYPCYEKFDFTIYNRWGEVVFESHDTQTCWNGIYRGEKANTGTYAWSFYVNRSSGEKIIRKGTITLIR